MHLICMFLNYTDRIIEKLHKMNEENILIKILFIITGKAKVTNII